MPEISTQVVAIDKVVAKVEKQESLGRIPWRIGALEFCIYGARAVWIASKRQTVVYNMPIRFRRVVCEIRRCRLREGQTLGVRPESSLNFVYSARPRAPQPSPANRHSVRETFLKCLLTSLRVLRRHHLCDPFSKTFRVVSLC